MRFPLIPFFLLLLASPTETWSQEVGSYSGEYSTIQTSTDTVKAEDGSMVLKFTYQLVQIADDRDSPFAHMIGSCWGTAVLENEDTPVGAGGACHLIDGKGNGYWQWWHQGESGTEACPIRCGAFGDYGGYGDFEGYSSEGTWNMIVLFPAGGGFGEARSTYRWR